MHRNAATRIAALVFVFALVCEASELPWSLEPLGDTSFDSVRVWTPPHGSPVLFETLVLLHGNQGQTDDPTWFADLRQQARFRRSILVVPGWSRGEYRWDRPQAVRALLALLDRVARAYPVDPRRTYLVGYSAGGSRVLPIAARAPDRFAGVVAIAGDIGRPLRGTPLSLGALRKVPALLVCMSQDRGPNASCALDEANARRLARQGMHVERRRIEGTHDFDWASLAAVLGAWLDARPRAR